MASGMMTALQGGDAKKKQLVGLFEPVVVEYLVLERHVAKSSTWDNAPHRLQRIRQLGYSATRAKIEALWAFIEAHEKILAESPAMERFPDLSNCIRQVVGECKNDLEVLEDIRPRRFFYCKHLLALRVILNRRLEKLKKFTAEGWISPADGQGLIEALWERIIQAEQFFPQIQTTAHTKHAHLEVKAGGLERQRTSLEGCNAWDGVEIIPVSTPKAKATASDAREKAIMCWSCGNVFVLDAVFCRKCGKRRQSAVVAGDIQHLDQAGCLDAIPGSDNDDDDEPPGQALRAFSDDSSISNLPGGVETLAGSQAADSRTQVAPPAVLDGPPCMQLDIDDLG